MRTRQDQARRSMQDWERGRGAKRISNPNYMPEIRNGRKVYVLRDKTSSKKIENKSFKNPTAYVPKRLLKFI